MIWAWKPADYTIRSKQTKEDIRELRIPDDFHGGAHDNDDEEQAPFSPRPRSSTST